MSVEENAVFKVGSRMSRDLGCISGQLGLPIPSLERSVNPAGGHPAPQKKNVRINETAVDQIPMSASAAEQARPHTTSRMQQAAFQWGDAMDYHLAWTGGVLSRFQQQQQEQAQNTQQRMSSNNDSPNQSDESKRREERQKEERRKRRKQKEKKRKKEQAKEIAQTLLETFQVLQENQKSSQEKGNRQEDNSKPQRDTEYQGSPKTGVPERRSQTQSRQEATEPRSQNRPPEPRDTRSAHAERTSSFVGGSAPLSHDFDESRYYRRAKAHQKQLANSKEKIKSEYEVGDDGNEVCSHCLIHHGKTHTCKSPKRGLEGMMNYTLQVDAPNNVVERVDMPKATRSSEQRQSVGKEIGNQEKRKSHFQAVQQVNRQERPAPVYLEYSPPHHGQGQSKKNASTMPELSLQSSRSPRRREVRKEDHKANGRNARSQSPASLAGAAAAHQLKKERHSADGFPPFDRTDRSVSKRDNERITKSGGQLGRTMAAGNLTATEMLRRSRKSDQASPPRRVDKSRDSTKGDAFLRKGTGAISSGNFVSTR
eukprot:gb/GECG01009231.1/.p1 GENE.gb/GECG01009231.1/~~gb/GECG01009231.1/.p1  ORF type:complete len:539 (+),score=89.22 gb/GECG01009231.1/:1-1617(+)